MLSLSQGSVVSVWSEGESGYPVSAGGGSGRVKDFLDPIHRQIRFCALELDFIDTPQFQRLRELKQLGSTYFVFSGASHHRFEHCLGVGHLAGQLGAKFMATQPELELTPRDVTLLRIAGLCHDIGHGPFSHVFDSEFMPIARPGVSWSHEEMSLKILDYLVDDNAVEIEREELQFVKDAICAGKGAADRVPRERQFMYEIVACKRNGVDVDKFDYLARDTYNLGLKSSFDYTRLMLYNRVINGEIAFQAKEVFTLYELFHMRYALHKTIYSHRAGKAVEYMIRDVLLEADNAWDRRISRSVDDPAEYCKLTDALLREVENSTTPLLARGRALLHDLRTRKLYRFVDEYILPQDKQAAERVRKVTPVDISTCNVTAGVDISPEDIIVHDSLLNYGSRDRNPVDSARFYRHDDDTESFSIRKEKVSYILPHTFQERIIRVYSRSREPAKVMAVQRAFRAFMSRISGRSVSPKADPSSRVWSSPTKRGGSSSSTAGMPLMSSFVSASSSHDVASSAGGVLSRGNRPIRRVAPGAPLSTSAVAVLGEDHGMDPFAGGDSDTDVLTAMEGEDSRVGVALPTAGGGGDAGAAGGGDGVGVGSKRVLWKSELEEGTPDKLRSPKRRR